MKRLCLFISIVLCCILSYGQYDAATYAKTCQQQTENAVIRQYHLVEPFFREAYKLYPTVPRGVLEAVAFTYSRFYHLSPKIEEDTSGQIPPTYGVMGLTLDGKGYFRENLKLVSQLSGYSMDQIVSSPRDNVVAYAAAYAALQKQMGITSKNMSDQFPILDALSELPVPVDKTHDFVIQSQHYAFCLFVNHARYRMEIPMEINQVDTRQVFGTMLPILQSGFISISDSENNEIQSFNKIDGLGDRSCETNETDFANALWVPAGACNYSNRSGHEISAITIHYTQGTYAGSISWFQNCSYNGVGAQASAHYVVRSIDGQITQMVRESKKAWHVGNCNPYTVGIEHEAYGDIASFFTPAMYQSSAALTRDICNRYNISPLRMFYRDTLDDGTVLNYGLHDLGGESACIKIRGHQHFPGQTHTDPGRYWNWNYYYKLVNSDTPITELSTASGTFMDSGGAIGDYASDERQITTIHVEDAERITLSFSEFDLEDNYDFLWIYDGNSVFAPLIGRWNTTSPGTVTSSGNSLTIEFRSDCATTAAGWVAQWRTEIPVTDNPPATIIAYDENQWLTNDCQIEFEDEDDHGLMYRFYQVMGNDGIRWTANPARGFACDNFDDFNTSLWHVYGGNWSVNNHQLVQSSMTRAVLSFPLQSGLSNAYMYDWYGSMSNWSANSSFEMLFDASSQDVSNQGMAYSIVFNPQEHRLQLRRWLDGISETVSQLNNIYTVAGANYFYRIIHDEVNGKIMIFRDGHLLLDWQDPAPIRQTGQNVSLETNGMNISFDNWRVYRSRGNQVVLQVAGEQEVDAPWQANNGNARAKLKSIVVDDNYQFSSLVEKSIKIDTTPPILSSVVQHTLNGGFRRLCVETVMKMSWSPASDPQSGVNCYEYQVKSVGRVDKEKAPNRTTDCGFSYDFGGHMEDYIVKVRAVNNAGLASPYIYYSKENLFASRIERSCVKADKHHVELTISPNPACCQVEVSLTEPKIEPGEGVEVKWNSGIRKACIYDLSGRKVIEVPLLNNRTTIDIGDLSSGMYVFRIYAGEVCVAIEKVVKE